MTAHIALNARKFIVPAAPHKNIPAIRRVELNAGFRPIKSLEIPQNEAPRIKPV